MIDYQLLTKSIVFYETYHFKRIESPWLVSKPISDITKPKDVSDYKVIKDNKEKIFVASGEQSFLYLINKGFIPSGKYQTITPCIRNDTFSSFHTKYFMKNELINFGDDISEKDVEPILTTALEFFKSIADSSRIKIVKTDAGFDIELNGIEIGSYGYRECVFTKWCYATGLALPRFSVALNWKG